MASENNISSFTAADIEKYHRGLLSAAEMHRMEKAALEDPFLADALEGYQLPGIQVQDDLNDLQKRLELRIRESADEKVVPITGRKGGSGIPWLRAAAAVILVAGAGWLTYRLAFDSSQDDSNKVVQVTPAKTEKQNDQTTGTDSRNANGYVAADSVKNNKTSINIDEPAQRETSGKTTPSRAQTQKQDDALTDNARPRAANSDKETPAAVAELKKQENASVTSAPPPVTFRSEKVKIADEYKTRETEGFSYKKQADGRQQTRDKDIASVPAQPRKQGLIQRNIYRGQVTDANNNPLPFANITNTQDGVGTYADAKGNFVLTSSDSILNVKVRSVGFETNQVPLQHNGLANQVVMEEDRSQVQALVLNNRQLNTNRARSSTIVFEEPEPLDGWVAYDTYLANNIKQPENLMQQKRTTTGGEVSVSFEVNEYGEPVNFRVEKSLCDVCDKEAIRLIKEGPRWKRKAGKRVTVSVPFG